MSRVEIDPASTDPGAFYRLMTATVIPRPIAWISSLSGSGVANLAPHSFFTVSSVDPPVMQFTSVGRKDSQNNIEQTGEFVINFAPASLFEQVNATATDFPPEVSEFEAVGVEPEPSALVAPPRVAGSPVSFECRYLETRRFGGSSVLFGEVVHAAIEETALEDGRPASALLEPLARLGGIEWAELGSRRQITRIPHAEWPGHYE